MPFYWAPIANIIPISSPIRLLLYSPLSQSVFWKNNVLPFIKLSGWLWSLLVWYSYWVDIIHIKLTQSNSLSFSFFFIFFFYASRSDLSVFEMDSLLLVKDPDNPSSNLWIFYNSPSNFPISDFILFIFWSVGFFYLFFKYNLTDISIIPFGFSIEKYFSLKRSILFDFWVLS